MAGMKLGKIIVAGLVICGFICVTGREVPAGEAKSSKLKISEQAPEEASVLAGMADRLVVGKPVVHENLVLFPLAWKSGEIKDEYVTLETAAVQKTLTIKEKDQASVPTLSLENNNREPVFLMTGEVLTGAKQDRILAHDILISPETKELDIPVYCVEQGRWTEKSANFAPAENVASIKVRAAAQSKTAQGEVWRQVGETNSKLGGGRSDSIQTSFENDEAEKKMAGYETTLKDFAKEGRAGVVAAINGEFTNMDLFGSPELFKKLWPKLLKAYALDAALADDTKKAAPSQKEAAEFVNAVFQSEYVELDNPGLGSEFMVKSGGLRGSVLVHEKNVVHLGLFPFEGPAEPPAGVPTAMPPERWVEETPNQMVPQIQEQRGMPAQGAVPGSRGSIKKDGKKFEIKNPSKVGVDLEE